MRVLALSPGSLQQQLERLPALAGLCEQLDASLQVACDPLQAAVWTLLPSLEKVLPFSFENNPTLADWANLLGCVREPDFQVCINFAKGQQVNLMLSMSHIPKRLAKGGFACTDPITDVSGWPAQRLAPYLEALGCSLQADSFRLSLPSDALDAARAEQPSGDGPLLLLAPSAQVDDWPEAEWTALPERIRSRLAGLRTVALKPGFSLLKRAAAIACSDVVLSSCPVSQLLATYTGIPLVALGTAPSELPERPDLRCLGTKRDLNRLDSSDVLNALGF